MLLSCSADKWWDLASKYWKLKLDGLKRIVS
jgi:hypothetical protein